MTTPYCVIGCTRGTGLQIARQLAERGAPVLGVARDPVKARGLLPAAAEIRAGDVTDPGSLSAARLGACCAIFFAVDITGGVGGRGFFKPASQIRAVTYEGLVNVVDAAKAAVFTGRIRSRVRYGVRTPVLHRPAAQRYEGRPAAQPAGPRRISAEQRARLEHRSRWDPDG